MRNLVLLAVLAIGSPLCMAANTEYFAFVGEKVSLEPVERGPNEGPRLDSEFSAKYRIIQSVYGSFDGAEIEFQVFDHYGTPTFAQYQHVLLFVVLFEGKYYHSKYMFDPVYRTKSGRWAGPYSTDDYDHEYNKKTRVKPEVIDFDKPVEINLSASASEVKVKKWYPQPYYAIHGDKITAVYGNYVEDLFRLKQGGVLKARGEFQ